MIRLGKSCKAVPPTAFLILLISGFAGQTFANTKPKFVYVSNTGASAVDSFQAFKVGAVASCPNFACFSVEISGTFTLNKNLGVATSASSITLTDTAELPAPLVLPLGIQEQIGSNVALIFGQFANGVFTGPTVTLVFPGTATGGDFPSGYSGGALCVTPLGSGCGASSVAQFTDSSGAVTATFINGDVTTTTTPPVPPGPGGVWGYAIDSTTGALTVIPGSPFAVGIDPHSVAVDPSNRFVYVANATSNDISAFAVDSTTGVLTPVGGSPFAAGLNPYSVAVDPSDRFVYVANQISNNVSAYTLDKTTGALTPMSGSPFPAGTGPILLTLDPMGRFAYVTNAAPVGQESISGYTIDATTGALKEVSGTPLVNGQATINTPVATVVDPSGKFLYEYFEDKSGAVLNYAIDGTTGALTEFASPTGPTQPLTAAIDPLGGFVFQAASNGSVSGYGINSTTGALTGMSMPVVMTGGGLPPVSMAIDPSGSFSYVANSSTNNIYAFTINGATGAWTSISGSPITTGAGPSSLAIAGSTSTTFESFKARVEIDEDRRTSFRLEGSFQLPAGSVAIDPVSQSVELQVGTYLVTIPANSFRKLGGHDSDGDRDRDRDWGRHGFVYDGEISDVDLNVRIQSAKDNGYRFTAEGRGKILQGITNPVTVGITIGNFEGSATVKADIDK